MENRSAAINMIGRLIEQSGINNTLLSAKAIKSCLSVHSQEVLLALSIITQVGHAQEILCPECGEHFAVIEPSGNNFIGSCEKEDVTTFEINANDAKLYRLDNSALLQQIAKVLQLKERVVHAGDDMPLWYLGSYTGSTASVQVYLLHAPLNEKMREFINTRTLTHAVVITTHIAHVNELGGIKKPISLLDLEQQLKPIIIRKRLYVNNSCLEEIANSPGTQQIYFDGSTLYFQNESVCTVVAGGPTAAFIQTLYDKMWELQGVSYEKIYAACNNASKRSDGKSKDIKSFCQTKLSEIRNFAEGKRDVVDKIIHTCTAPDGKPGYRMGLS